MQISGLQWKIKKKKKIVVFLDTCILISNGKIFLLWTKYLSSQVNSPKISDMSKRDVFQLNLRQDEDTIGSKCCRVDFNSVLNALIRWLCKGVLKQDLLVI